MEKNILKFGKSSAVIILPKKWLDKKRLKTSDPVFITENSTGDLVISAKELGKTSFTTIIDRQTDPDIVARFAYFYYMRGVSKLIIHSRDTITYHQIEQVRKTINYECPGFEMIAQSDKEIILEDLTDLKEMDINKVISRLRSLVGQQLTEIKNGQVANVKGLEELADRFYSLGIRYVNVAQPNETTKYYRSIILLESISDNLPIVAQILAKGNSAIINTLIKMFELSKEAFEGNRSSLLQIETLKKEITASVESSKLEANYKQALKSIARQLTQIGEFGLLLEDPALSVER